MIRELPFHGSPFPKIDLPIGESSHFSFLTYRFTDVCFRLHVRQKDEMEGVKKEEQGGREGGKERRREGKGEKGNASLLSIPNFPWYFALCSKNS